MKTRNDFSGKDYEKILDLLSVLVSIWGITAIFSEMIVAPPSTVVMSSAVWGVLGFFSKYHE